MPTDTPKPLTADERAVLRAIADGYTQSGETAVQTDSLRKRGLIDGKTGRWPYYWWSLTDSGRAALRENSNAADQRDAAKGEGT